jgi:hypothetical protein
LIASDIRLESIYLVVGSLKLIAGCLKLIRKFFSRLSCVFDVCGCRASRPVNEPEDGIPRPVQQIGFRTAVFSFRRVRNNSAWRICPLISHRSPQLNLPRDISPSNFVLTQFDRCG